MACLLRLVLAYDGGGFSGFSSNRGVRTVEGVLTEALERRLGGSVANLTAAGRTDAGVHAAGQVVSFESPVHFTEDGDSLERLRASLNGMCGPEIAVLAAEVAPEGFNARFSASSRRYRYTICNRRESDPFTWRWSWHVPQTLELPDISEAAASLLGEWDFATFCRRSRVKVDGALRDAPTTRRVMRASAERLASGELRFEIEANSFCRQMVRSIVGTLVDVGRGRFSPADFESMLRSPDRSSVGTVAPPQGLCLLSVGYPPQISSPGQRGGSSQPDPPP